jgi:D-glycero-alpha-D-manno-heptose-7-phosphate kinase
MIKITAEAPTRIDLAGGTLDIPPLHLFHHPTYTINTAINRKVKVTIATAKTTKITSHDQNKEAGWKKPEDVEWKNHPELELIIRLVQSFNLKENAAIEVESEVPAGSGLGGSSALAIALTKALGAWTNQEQNERELIEHAKSIETETIGVPTGYQDYWGPTHGDLRAYHIKRDGTLQKEVLGSEKFKSELQKHMMLIYTGKPRFSGVNNWELFKKHMNGDTETINFFETLKENALTMKRALESENIQKVANALNTDWETRKAMLPTMTTKDIEKLITTVKEGGTHAARVCGAGGGGCVLLLTPLEKQEKVKEVIRKMGMELLPTKISRTGVATTKNE